MYRTRITAALLALFMLFSMLPMQMSAEFILPEMDAEGSNLPAAVSLKGDKHLPAIGNQGGVGSCQSEATAYMQFTNAVSRYIEANRPDMEWDPSLGTQWSGNQNYLFSPKFTYTVGYFGVHYIADVLRDHGCATIAESNFAKVGTGSQYKVNGKLVPSAVSWDIIGETGWNALKFRLKNIKTFSLLCEPYIDMAKPKVNDQANTMFTTSEAGRAALEQVKDALNRGNVVTAGCDTNRWVYSTVQNGGTYGAAGESVIVASSGSAAGNHIVSIIGYDDNLTATYQGVTLKGAFLMANSWGNWKNNGCCWVMYDALNTISEYPDLAGYPAERTWTFYDLYVTYWDKDVVVDERPDRMLKVDIEAADREAPYVVLTMSDKETGETFSHTPAVFKYGVEWCAHPDYEMFNWQEDGDNYLTFSGVQNGAAEKETFYFNYDPLIDLIPAGKSTDDYFFGAKFGATRGASVTYSDLALITQSGETIEEQATPFACAAGGLVDKTFKKNVLFSNAKMCNVYDEEGTGYFFNHKADAVRRGEDLTFTLSAVSGYSAENAVVTANGVVLEPVNGRYTVKNVMQDVTLSASGIVKQSAGGGCTVRYYTDQGLYSSGSCNPGDTIAPPAAPVKAGYRFAGWSADIYEQPFDCIETPFPTVMPGCSFNAYAVFEREKETITLSGGRYGTGMENYDGKTVLLFTIPNSDNLDAALFWTNRAQYHWTLHYSWEEDGVTRTMDQSGIMPDSNYVFSTYTLFRFAVCEYDIPLDLQKDLEYRVSLTLESANMVYEINATSGFSLHDDPIKPENNTAALTAEHYFTSGTDFEYWSKKTYMTLSFKGNFDPDFCSGAYRWILCVTDDTGNTSNYTCFPNSFYIFSDTCLLVRFPVLEFGWIPQYRGKYAIEFQVYRENQKLYTSALSDVSSLLQYRMMWTVDGRTVTTYCPIGEIPSLGEDPSTETLTERYDHIAWVHEPKPATEPAEYVSMGVTTTLDYVITFRSEGNIISQKGYAAGETVLVPPDPEKQYYTFTGWSPAVSATATGNATYTATFVETPCTHVWNAGVVTKAATCTEAGERLYTCLNNPAHTRTEVIPAAGHRIEGWRSDQNLHWKECSACGLKEQSAAHTFGAWQRTGENARLEYRCCTVCGYREEQLLDADPGDLSGNGIVDTADVVALLQSLTAARPEVNRRVADFNNDGRVSVADAVAILRYLAKTV